MLSEHTVRGGLDISGLTREELQKNSFIYQPIYQNIDAINAVRSLTAESPRHGGAVFDSGISPRIPESPRHGGGIYSGGFNFEAQNNEYMNTTAAASAAFVLAGALFAGYVAKKGYAQF